MNILYKTLLDTFESCERKGYLKYMFAGHGIELDSPRGYELAKGVAIHKGIETIWKTGDIQKAITVARAEYTYEMRAIDKAGLDLDFLAAVEREHNNLIEAVLWLWFLARYPKLTTEYDYVAAEYRLLVPLTVDMSLLAIPDSILKAKLDGRFLNWSLKTEKAHSRMKHPAALIDTGGLTEAISAAMTVGDGDLRSIAGTAMEYLVVGSLDKDEPIIWHPALRGWRKERPAGGVDYAWKFKFANPDYDPKGPKSPKHNPKEMSMGKGWTRFEAANYINDDGQAGIEFWVRDLIARKFMPFGLDPLDDLILAPHPYVRPAAQIESFIRQKVAEHTRLEANRKALAAGTANIDEAFPQRRGTCLKFGDAYRCEFWAICWEGAGVDPMNLGFRKRDTARERDKARAEYDKLLKEKEASR